MSDLDPRSPRESRTEKTEIVLPQHANALGTAFGGTVMSWVDIAAAVAAQRHCGQIAVTASVDRFDFLAPLRVGNVVRILAVVTGVFRTSMEVWVRVERESLSDPRQRTLCAESWLTFVNMSLDGNPVPVPPLRLENDDDRAHEAAAKERRNQRLAARAAY